VASKNQEREAREARERLRLYNARQSVHAHQVKRRKRDNIIAIAAVVVIATVATLAQLSYFTFGPGAPTPTPTDTSTPTPTATPTPEANVGDIPSPDAAEDRAWTGTMTLNSTELGITLDGVLAPQATASLVTDIRSGYFDGKTCHRLVATESANLIQCGSADGTGASDPNYQFGPLENVPADGVYPAGSIAMARSTSAYSNGHQFFITTTDTTLDGSTGGYTIVGQVTSGLDDLKTDITDAGVAADGTAPVTATTITSVTIQ
jgi:peptidyl-prolyl cis-trans isomerase B (cyclophilin B)